MKRRTALATLGLLSGCTFEAGHGFSTLEGVRLSAELVPGEARDLDGAVLTDRGYRVELDRFELSVESIELLALSNSGTQTSFDPASPPEGYSLCHGGHCHSEDGRLVDYVDVEAALAGGSESFVTIATLPVERTLDLLQGQRVSLRRVEPSRELPLATLRKLTLNAGELTLRGTVRGPTLEPTELRIELARVPVFGTGIDLAITRDGPEQLELDIRLEFDGASFDGIEFAELATPEGIRITNPDESAGARLLQGLSRADLTLRR